MEKRLFALMLALTLAVACRKNDDNNHEPPIVNQDTVLYKVTTVMDVEGTVGGIAIAEDGTIFYSAENKIYKIKDSIKSLLAGAEAGYRDGPGASARFDYPGRMAVDDDDNLYVADRNNNHVRKIDRFGHVSTMIFSILDSVYDNLGQIIDITNTKTDKATDVGDLNVKGNHLYIMCYPGGNIYGYNMIACRLDHNNLLSKKANLFEGGTFRSIDVTQDEKFLYWCNIYGISKLDLITDEITNTNHYDNEFVNFVLGEGDSIIYKPRIDKCTIDRMSLTSKTDSLIAGQINNSPLNVPHPSIDGIGVHASFNHINFIKKKNNYLYIAEADYVGTGGGKIRKMRVP